MTTFRSRIKRWHRVRGKRPVLRTTAFPYFGLVVAVVLLLVTGLCLMTAYASALHWLLHNQEARTVSVQHEYDDLMTAHLICLNGGAPYAAVETLPSGQHVRVFTVCEPAKERIFLE